MNHEKEFKREDGSKCLVEVSCFLKRYSSVDGNMKYNVKVATKAPKKKKWEYIGNSDDYKYRALSMEDRRKHDFQCYLEVVTIEEIQETALELWETLKPKFI